VRSSNLDAQAAGVLVRAASQAATDNVEIIRDLRRSGLQALDADFYFRLDK
jgi:hypothetical protein